MSRELFGTDGVRGLFGKYPLDTEGATRIGRAVGTQFAEPGETVVIACDPRESSDELQTDVITGLLSVGVNVKVAGVLPTPGLAYITRQNEQFVAGIMITASHNPYQYNGVKVFDANGDKLTDESESGLNSLIEDGVPDRGQGVAAKDINLAQTYDEFLYDSVQGLRLDGVLIAVDAANGAASGLAERTFLSFGALVTGMFNTPNGRNINDGCGATNVAALATAVVDNNLTMGVALDGDADRVVLVDSQGRTLNGDHIIYILAVANDLKGVIATSMSNLGLENACRDKGIDFKRVDVGDRYVLEGLRSTGYKLGGEQAGHIILPDLLATGDGLLAAIQTVQAVQQSGKSLDQWRDELNIVPQALVNIGLEDKSRLDREKVKDYIAEESNKFGKEGRLVIRPSGTEPLARVMVEAPDAETQANRIANRLKELLA
jgi:phosphoglucosamine mutase